MGNSLFDMYVKCGGKRHWNYFNKCNSKVWDHFVGLLNTCASVVALEVGRWAHDQIIQCAWDLGALVGSSLVDMYAKCGNFWACLEILQRDGISRCGHLEWHDWEMCNGCPDDENASTHHLIYTNRELAFSSYWKVYQQDHWFPVPREQ